MYSAEPYQKYKTQKANLPKGLMHTGHLLMAFLGWCQVEDLN